MSVIKNTFFEQVSTFNKNIIGYIPPLEVELLPSDVKELTLIQLREEVTELENSHTPTDELDALIDLVYFAYGAMYKMGVTPPIFGCASTIVHNANMTKAAGKKANRGYEGAAVDAVKPSDFVAPEQLISVLIKDGAFNG